MRKPPTLNSSRRLDLVRYWCTLACKSKVIESRTPDEVFVFGAVYVEGSQLTAGSESYFSSSVSITAWTKSAICTSGLRTIATSSGVGLAATPVSCPGLSDQL